MLSPSCTLCFIKRKKKKLPSRKNHSAEWFSAV
jgi:hypothetical protein